MGLFSQKDLLNAIEKAERRIKKKKKKRKIKFNEKKLNLNFIDKYYLKW